MNTLNRTEAIAQAYRDCFATMDQAHKALSAPEVREAMIDLARMALEARLSTIARERFDHPPRAATIFRAPFIPQQKDL